MRQRNQLHVCSYFTTSAMKSLQHSTYFWQSSCLKTFHQGYMVSYIHNTQNIGIRCGVLTIYCPVKPIRYMYASSVQHLLVTATWRLLLPISITSSTSSGDDTNRSVAPFTNGTLFLSSCTARFTLDTVEKIKCVSTVYKHVVSCMYPTPISVLWSYVKPGWS